MSRKSRRKGSFKLAIRSLAAVIILSIVFSSSVFASANTSAANAAGVQAGADSQAKTETFDIQYLQQLIEMIKAKYKGVIDDDTLVEGAIRGIFSTLDPYTTFFDKEEYEDFYSDVQGEYQGVGIMISQFGRTVVVSKVFPGSPAEKAGVRIGDYILEVDGKSIRNNDEASKYMQGEAGSKVKVVLRHQGADDTAALEIERGIIKVNPVTYDIIDENIGYIKLEIFNNNSFEFMKQTIEELEKKKVEKVILDLRNNPGGLLDQATDIAEFFVPEGLIVKVDNKEEEDEEIYSDLKKLKFKTVVLVNEMSASSSEVLAGAIQDTNAGTLVGTKTYGKAKIQQLFPILNPEAYKDIEERTGYKIVNAYDLIKYNVMPEKGDIIGYTKITTGEYLTPKGRNIDGVGISPDVAVEALKDNKVDTSSLQKLVKSGKYNLGDEDLEIYNAEKILYAAGYEMDRPDLKLDEKTLDAIMKFQADSELCPYGVIDFATQDALNRKADEIKIIYDVQFAKAIELLKK